MTTLDKLTSVIEKAVDDFNKDIDKPVKAYGNLTPTQKLFNDVSELVSQLERKPDGSLKKVAKNIGILRQINKKVANILASKTYTDALNKLNKTFEKVTELQNQYYAEQSQKFSADDFSKVLQNEAIKDVVNSIRGTKAKAEITTGIDKVLRASINGGINWVDALQAVQKEIIGAGEGALLRHSKTMTTDGLNQYARAYGEIIGDSLGFEWYEYTGPIMGTSRCFCRKMVKRRFFHKSQIAEIIKGEGCPIYEKTGLAYGLIEDTNTSNFIKNLGGYGCQHQANQVSVARVQSDVIFAAYKDGIKLNTASLNKLKKAKLI